MILTGFTITFSTRDTKNARNTFPYKKLRGGPQSTLLATAKHKNEKATRQLGGLFFKGE